MSNPLIAQGTLNRLRASVSIPAFPTLNVTAAYLGKDGIGVAFQGDQTLMIPTLTGTVTSPEPYQLVEITMALLRTQALGDAYKVQAELSTLLGDLTMRPDSSILSPYTFRNCAIQRVRDLPMNGTDAGYVVTLGGYYNINDDLWNLV